MGFHPHPVPNLPRRCPRLFFFHLPLSSLLLLVVRLFLSPVLLFPCFAACIGFESWNLLFSPRVMPEGPPPQRLFRSLTSSSIGVPVLTASNHSPSLLYSLFESRHNASSGLSSSIIFLQAIPVTLEWRMRFSISSKKLAISPRYLTDPISLRALSASWLGPKRHRAFAAKTC